MNGEYFLQVAGLIVALGAVSVALNAIVLKVLKPTYRVIRTLDKFASSLPVILEIAEEFKPNSGATLRDQVDEIKIKLVNIEGQLEVIALLAHRPGNNMVDDNLGMDPSTHPSTFDLPTTGATT